MTATGAIALAIFAAVVIVAILWSTGLFHRQENDMGMMEEEGDERKDQTVNVISVDEWIKRYGAAPATEMPRPTIRPASGSKPLRVTWKDEAANAQSIVMGTGPAKVLLPALVDEMIAGAITELKVRVA